MTCNGTLSQYSIFMAEAYAVLQAIRYVTMINGLKEKEIVEIRSDAQGLLKSLEQVVHTNILLCRIKEALRNAYHDGRNIVLKWVPGHQNIYGNEWADALAKQGVDRMNTTFIPIIDRDVEHLLKNRRQLAVQNAWDNFGSSNVKRFLPTMESVNHFLKSYPSVALCQIVSGHTRLTEFVCRVLGLKASSQCACGKGEETVEHFLFHCCLYDAYRVSVWEDFQPNFAYVAKEWTKLREFVKLSGRFEGTIRRQQVADIVQK